MEFVCEHCGAGAVRIVAVTDETIKVECVMCGKESIIQREPAPMLVATTQPQS